MSKIRNIKARQGRGPLRLSGAINDISYRLGVANPFNRENPAPLNARHLSALRALLGFVDPAHPEKQFAISEAEFAKLLSNDNAWLLLVDLLTCWVRTRTGGIIIDCHFATVSFCKHEEGMTAFVSLSEHILPVLKPWIDSAPR